MYVRIRPTNDDSWKFYFLDHETVLSLKVIDCFGMSIFYSKEKVQFEYIDPNQTHIRFQCLTGKLGPDAVLQKASAMLGKNCYFHGVETFDFKDWEVVPFEPISRTIIYRTLRNVTFGFETPPTFLVSGNNYSAAPGEISNHDPDVWVPIKNYYISSKRYDLLCSRSHPYHLVNFVGAVRGYNSLIWVRTPEKHLQIVPASIYGPASASYEQGRSSPIQTFLSLFKKSQ